MVLPEGAREEDVRRPRQSRTLFVVVGALAIAVGILGLGTLTSPEPEPLVTPETAPETTTTTTTTTTARSDLRIVDVDEFSVSEIAVGAPLDWERDGSFEGFFPLALVEHEGRLYLFGRTSPTWGSEPGRLGVWRSEDGTEWESLGDVLGDDVDIVAVSGTGQGLVATERGSRGDELGVWTSPDAISWTPRPIPLGSGNPALIVSPQAVWADGERLVVVAQKQLDFATLIEEHLGRAGQEVDLSPNRGWGTEYIDGETRVTIYGPLGLPALSVPIDELGLSEEEFTEAERGFSGDRPSTPVWTSLDGTEWIETSIEGAQWVESLVETSDGTLLATGFGISGEQAWSSGDGLVWEEHADDASMSRVASWGQRLVAASNNRPEVLISDDSVSWEETGLRHHFPAPINWYVSDLTADDRGLAVAVEGWSRVGGLAPQRPDPPTIRRDDVTLTIDFETGRFEIDSGTETLTWMMYGQPGGAGRPEVDLVDGTVGFLHPETGEPLITLSFEELDGVEEQYWIGGSADQRFPALALSPDGGDWAIKAIDDELEEARIADIEMAGDRLIAVVISGDDFYSPRPDPGFEVWTAVVP